MGYWNAYTDVYHAELDSVYHYQVCPLCSHIIYPLSPCDTNVVRIQDLLKVGCGLTICAIVRPSLAMILPVIAKMLQIITSTSNVHSNYKLFRALLIHFL